MVKCLPTKGGVSTTIGPRSILTGQQLDYNRHHKTAFGSYAQVHEENQPMNSTQPHTIGAICMGPSGNIQGGYKFLNLLTGKKIVRCQFTALPIPTKVIYRVDELSQQDQQPVLITFYDRFGNPIIDDTDDFELVQRHPEITGVESDQQQDNKNKHTTGDTAGDEGRAAGATVGFDPKSNTNTASIENNTDTIDLTTKDNDNVTDDDDNYFFHHLEHERANTEPIVHELSAPSVPDQYTPPTVVPPTNNNNPVTDTQQE